MVEKRRVGKGLAGRAVDEWRAARFARMDRRMDDQAEIRRLGPEDLAAMRAMTAMLGAAFEEPDEYGDAPPSDDYLRDLLTQPGFVALAAFAGEAVIGGLVAYEFRKFEQARSEFYIYDLAIADGHRRRGVATALIEAIKPIAAARGGYVLIIQADADNDPAIALYGKLGVREEPISFDIAVPTTD